MTEPIRVGTRGSALALRQTALVLARLERVIRTSRFSVVPILTQGDREPERTRDLDFTDAIDRALEEGSVDLAVHSAKDLSVDLPRSLRIAALLPRADPRDSLVTRGAIGFYSLPPGSRIGSSSPRRRAQVRRARPDLVVVEMRGNVDSRLARLSQGEVDGLLLASAGLDRLGRGGEVSERMDVRRFLPAPGQGAIVVTTRGADRKLAAQLARIDHRPTRAAVVAERAFVAGVGGDCDTPLGALARVRGDRIVLDGELLAPDGQRSVGARRTGSVRGAAAVGRALARTLLRSGGAELLARPRRG